MVFPKRNGIFWQVGAICNNGRGKRNFLLRATIPLKGMGKGSVGARLRGMGRGSAGARLRGMGRGNDAKTALRVIKETK